jgi:hypothetical protein
MGAQINFGDLTPYLTYGPGVLPRVSDPALLDPDPDTHWQYGAGSKNNEFGRNVWYSLALQKCSFYYIRVLQSFI